jgi:subtilisin family serine protease
MQRRANATRAAFEAFAAATEGVEIERRLWVLNGVTVRFTPDRVPVDRLGAVANVTAVRAQTTVSIDGGDTGLDADRADAGRVRTSVSSPDATSATADRTALASAPSATSSVETIRAPGTWELYGTRGDGVRVAVVDTGVDAAHPDIDLAPGGWAEFDSAGQATGSTPYDPNGHGTHVSGTVAGGADSGTYVGVAPGVELLHAKAFDESGRGTLAQLAAGVQWAIERDAAVVSLSLGSNTTRDRSFYDLIETAETAGVTVVAASGNSGAGTSVSPGDVYESLTVGATDGVGSVASFSGSETIERDEWATPPDSWPASYTVPDLVAPGVRINSTLPGGGYGRYSGTSMAVPHVTGVAALVLAATETRPSPVGLRGTVSTTASPLDDRPVRQGAGRVDAYTAVSSVADPRCGRIEYAGRVEIGSNRSTTGDCFVIASDDVILDGNGHTITAADGGMGLNITGGVRSNVTVRNLTLDGFATPVGTADGTTVAGLTIASVTATNTTGSLAITADGPVEATALDVTSSGDGLRIQNGTGVVVSNTTIDAAGVGLRLGGVEGATLTDTGLSGAPPLAAVAGTTDLVAADIALGSIGAVDINADGLTVSSTEQLPPAPESRSPVTAGVNVSSVSGPATLTVPYHRRADGTATLSLWRYDGDWNALATETNRTTGTLTATTDTPGTVVGYANTTRFGEYRLDANVTTLVFDTVDGAWVRTDATDSTAASNVSNPTLSLRPGRRYAIRNDAPAAFEIRTATGEVLVSQAATGALESDAAIEWVEDGDLIAFTVTDRFAEAAANYTAAGSNAPTGRINVQTPAYDPDSVAAEYDNDRDGRISIVELGAAAGDYANGQLPITDLGQIAAAYANS